MKDWSLRAPLFFIVSVFVALSILEPNMDPVIGVHGHKTIADDDEETEGVQIDAGAGDAMVDDMGEGVNDIEQLDDDGDVYYDPTNPDLNKQSEFKAPEPRTFKTLKDKIIGFF